VEIMKEFVIGDTIKFYVEIRTYDDVLIDPTVISLKIYDASDALKATLTPVKSVTGKYSIEWTINIATAQIIYAKLEYTAGGYEHVSSHKFEIVTYKTGAET
jgi:hypothetical protein